MEKYLSIFNKGLTVINGLIEVGKNENARNATLELLKIFSGGKKPTDAELDKVEEYLDAQLEEFNKPMPEA